MKSRLGLGLRDALFWLHLAFGIGAGIVIFLMSATGVLLMYERQITEWSDRDYRQASPPPAGARLSIEALLAKALTAQSGPPLSSLTLQADPAAPAAVSFGRERTVYVDPYTGRILGEGSPRVRTFFRAVTAWHRWLGAQGERRQTGSAITGACNLAFLILIVSGCFLWLPRQWTRRQLRNVVWFRRGLASKARDFNWHNVIGFWTWIPLFLVVLTGVVMSYSWANDLLFRLSGEVPPARQGSERPAAERGSRRERSHSDDAPELSGLDELWLVAERKVPGWRSITMRLPDEAEAPVSFTILQGHRGRPDLRSQLTLDRRSGEVVKWEPFARQGPGRRLRAWSRWVHTGEAGGFLGQTVAGLAAAGATLLVWTGWAMAWRRFFPAKSKKESRSPNNAARAAGETS